MNGDQTNRPPTHVVGIGASAGGLEAMEAFFDNLPTNTGMAFVVVQHLSPDFKSMMDDLLARHTQLPIQLVENGMVVEADHVYLIPPKKEMIISEGKLLLSERDRLQELTLPIDVFFRSLAQDAGARAIAVVLSGTGSDGSRGIRDVHDAGGLVVVQSVASAQFDGMPKSALDAGVAHTVLAPAEMPAALVEHAARAAQSHPAPVAASQDGIGAVYQMLLDDYGLDFTQYKPSTVTRRIERRLALAQSPDIEQYAQHVRRDRGELDLLYRDLLIGVTRFFRDPEAFATLEQTILPELLKRGSSDAPLRIWVAGCATGEEAYSLAIVLQDLMKKMGERPVKIFATDIHSGSLERASRGVYDEEAITNVSRERLERYFIRVGASYQVVPEVRQMVVFATHNVIKDAPFTRVDLVTCRNLLIYLQMPAQHKVLALFHFALNRGGVMFLGPSESAGPLAHDFESLDKHWRLYRKHSDVRTPVESRLQPFAHHDTRIQVAAPAARHSISQLLGTYDILLDEVMPPSLLVSESGELIHAFAGASRFLRMRDGRQRLDLLDVVDDELKMVLMGGLKRALHEPTAIAFKGVRINVDGKETRVDVSIRSIRNRVSMAHLLVSFEALDAQREPPVAKTVIDLDQVSRHQLASLEAQLSHTKESLQSAIEELETSNEELQASNEELQASNEELQSTNEELQSVNEELYTVNAEYQRKIAELTEVTNDMDNLLSSTDIGTIFLDKELRVRKFTPQIAEAFSLLPHDVGRSIETFAHRLDHPDLVKDLKTVLTTGTAIEREIRAVRGKALFLRILPYRAKGAVGGVVLTIIDVSGLKAAEDALFHERYLLNSLLASMPDAMYFKDTAGRFIRVNDAMARRLGAGDPREAMGKTVYEVPNLPLAQALHREDEAVMRSGEAQHYKLEKRPREDGTFDWELVSRLPMRDATGAIVGVGVVFRNVTEQKQAEERIQEAVRRRDEFLAMLSHELRNPLGAIVGSTALLRANGLDARRSDELLDILQRQSRQMARLLDDLLEASRVTQDKIELRKSNIDLRAVVKDAVDAVADFFAKRKVELTTDLGSEPIEVFGDPARLQQIHVNLLSNAAKYTQEGGHVTLSVRRDGDGAKVSVRDDGLGIPPAMLDSIFDLFVQCDSTLDRSGGGLGLGLTLVRSLLTMHGGTVVARSEGAGKGSEFVVRLPIVQPSASEMPSARADAVAQAWAALPKGAKIVIVEDNADSRELLVDLLEGAGFSCQTADNGVRALALMNEFRPHLAILDVGLPEMDGFEVARRIRGDDTHRETRLVALTGYGRASDRKTAVEAGFDAHLVKPVDPTALLSMLGCEQGQ